MKINPKDGGNTHIEKQIKKIANSMEKEFIKMMVNKMSETVKNSEDNSSMNYYKSLLNNEYADLIAKQEGGIGIARLIENQLLNKKVISSYNKGEK